jgi:hypothetical protein
MNEELLKKLLGYILIVSVIILTIKFIKVLPVIMKLLALAANVLTIYLAYNYFINTKNKKN